LNEPGQCAQIGSGSGHGQKYAQFKDGSAPEFEKMCEVLGLPSGNFMSRRDEQRLQFSVRPGWIGVLAEAIKCKRSQSWNCVQLEAMKSATADPSPTALDDRA
jgi:hypothetical protein